MRNTPISFSLIIFLIIFASSSFVVCIVEDVSARNKAQLIIEFHWSKYKTPKRVLEDNKKDLEILGRDIEKLKPTVEKDIPTVSYTEVLKLLKEKKGMDIEWGKDLRTIEEEKVMELFDTPIVVVDYPKEIMAFYKERKKLNSKEEKELPGPVALCFDMLAPEAMGEIIGGSQRDTDIKELEKYLKKEGEDPKMYDWYLDLRKYGSVPHSGYGVGVERVVRWICGLENIKDAIPFPRTMMRKRP